MEKTKVCVDCGKVFTRKGYVRCEECNSDYFVLKAMRVHGTRYDYSQSVYVKPNKKVKIICPVHGLFYQGPNNHLRGSGCPKCARIKYTTETFIQTAIQKQGDKYDYSQSIYVNSQKKVKIICPIHGMFEQNPNSHLRGTGCPRCGEKRVRRLSTEDFIQKAIQKHGDKYAYEEVEYVSAEDKVRIRCKDHGIFEQRASSHLSGHGCPECSGAGKLTREIFIEKARKIHGDKYCYEEVEYIGSQCKVMIRCKDHGGIFWITPRNHLRGMSCPVCSGKMLTLEAFIEEARKIHGDKYSYKDVFYFNQHRIVDIICPDHGKFEMSPKSHLAGNGCRKCRRAEAAGEMPHSHSSDH